MVLDFAVGILIYFSSCSVICFAVVLLLRPGWTELPIRECEQIVDHRAAAMVVSSTPLDENQIHWGRRKLETEVSPISRISIANKQAVGFKSKKIVHLTGKLDFSDEGPRTICKYASPRVVLHRQKAGGLRI